MRRIYNEDPLLEDATAGSAPVMKTVEISRKNDAKQIVYGVVYAPGEIDTHGETMFEDDIEEMCHRFMKRAMLESGAVIDVNHDNAARSAYPVECYIEREEGNEWPVGAWVLGVKIEDPGIWGDVQTGVLNGFSFEAFTKKMAVVVMVDNHEDTIGRTAKSENHDHVYFLEHDASGRVIGGKTSMDAGHWHEIKSGTATEMHVSSNGKYHAHRL